MFSRLYLGTNNPAEILSEVDLKHMSQLDERTKRHFLATRALSLGRHGVSLVAEASGVNRDTIYRGIRELKTGEQLPEGHVRKPGGGNKRGGQVLCDGGGANSSLHHVFKQNLMKLAKAIGMNILVMHYPPYYSKYNPIEHRLFAPFTRSWSGAPLLSAEMARQRAASTKTSKGLNVYASINNKSYETKRLIESTFESDKQKYIIFDD